MLVRSDEFFDEIDTVEASVIHCQLAHIVLARVSGLPLIFYLEVRKDLPLDEDVSAALFFQLVDQLGANLHVVVHLDVLDEDVFLGVAEQLVHVLLVQLVRRQV